MKHFPRAVSVPFALHYIEKSALGAVCRALCCCIYVEGEIRFPSPTPTNLQTRLGAGRRLILQAFPDEGEHKVKTFVLGLIVGVILVPLCGYFYFGSGMVPVATSAAPMPFEMMLAHKALDA